MAKLSKATVKPYTFRPVQVPLYEELTARLEQFDDTALVAGTGVGKAVIASHLAFDQAVEANPTLNGHTNRRAWISKIGCQQIVIIVHRDKLVDQIVESLQCVGLSRYFHEGNESEYNIWRGITKIKGNEHYDPTKPIVVASIQSLQRRYKKYINQGLLRPACLIFDECHTTAFAPEGKALIAARKHRKMIGFTATPFRLKKTEWFSQIFSNVVIAPSIAELMDAGALTRMEYFEFYHADIMESVSKTRKGWKEKEVIRKFDTPERIAHAVDLWEQSGCRDLKTIGFGVSVQHCKNLRDEFQRRGYEAEVISYELDKVERAPLYKGFASGRIQILLSVEALTVGFDEPSIECVFDVQPTESPSRHWQKIGRGMRLFPGKSLCYYLDLASNIRRLGAFGIPDMVKLTEKIVMDTKDPRKAFGEPPIKFCKDEYDSAGKVTVKGCNVVNHASAAKCKHCGKEFPKKSQDLEETIKGGLVQVVRPDMIRSLKDAKLFYRAMRMKRWIRGNDPNSAFFMYEESKTNNGDGDSISERYPIPSPYRKRGDHRDWAKGAITGKPTSIKAARAFLGQLIYMSASKTNPDQFIDLNMYLEFTDDVYVKAMKEHNEQKEEDALLSA